MAIKIALAGNPNSGKTTVFNELTGSSQYVGNWPGVTVEKKEGKLRGSKEVTIVDLPGIYSLSPYTLEEVVTRNFLVQESPDVIINVVDASNIERNLYLTTQMCEMGIPVIVALNMMDVVERNGDRIDMGELGKQLGCEVCPTSAVKGQGIKEMAARAVQLAKANQSQEPQEVFSGDVEAALRQIEVLTAPRLGDKNLRWHAIKLFERDEKIIEALKLPGDVSEAIEEINTACEEQFDDDTESIITGERYDYIAGVMGKCLKRQRTGMSTSDKIDRVVTNRWLALPIFAAIMFLVYFLSISWIGGIMTDWTNDVLFGEWIQPGVESWLASVGAADWLTGLLTEGVIGGVGAVLGFVPQMIVLFLLLSVLEDCGYMARVAFIMDRIFRRFGLSGKSFIPMLISSGCGVPGVMASRTIENEKDRRMTIMTTTFVPCGAKLPIIALIGGALFDGGWWVAPMVYFIGIAAVLFSGIVLKKMKAFAGDPAPFVMELPQYHMPRVKGVLIHMWERVRSFIVKAGTVIFISSAVIWFLGSFSWGMEMVDMDESMLASIGGFIAPIFAPLGFGEWKSAVASITGLVAKENVVGTFGVLMNLGDEIAENDPTLLGQVAMMFSNISAISFLLFNMLCAPCFAAIGAIRREMHSGKWTMFAIAYQTVLAYMVSLVVYQLGSLFTGAASFGVGTVVAILIVILMLYLLFRPNPNKKAKKAEVSAVPKSKIGV